jgi:diguanylate cyclase (GGDEF)-like protein
MRLNYLGVGLATATAIAFARAFFEERVFAGWINRATYGIATGVVVAPALVMMFAPWHIGLFDRLFALPFCALIAFVPIFLFRAWRVRSNYLWLFALAWSAPVAFAGIRIASNYNVIPWNFWIDNSTVLSMTAEALLSSLGITYRIRLLSQERDEARVKEMAARALADADPLTGLFNRRAFLRKAIGREGEQTLLILDIDHFKTVNETIGHDGGDEVLLRVARALRAAAPPDALVARIGGEEFAMIMSSETRIAGEDVLVRLRAQRMPFDLTVTASVGMCNGPLGAEADWKRLYRQADRALYEAKAQGRDRSRTGPAILAAA